VVWLVSHLKATWPPNANLTQPPQWCVPRGRRGGSQRRPGHLLGAGTARRYGADRAVPLGPHLDPLGPLLGQPHEQRHAGRDAGQFGVVLVAALEIFA
jgi:hypothetical protein